MNHKIQTENRAVLAKYIAIKNTLLLHERDFEVFEFRNGLFDGRPHSLRECGKKFNISATRVNQLGARLLWKLEGEIEHSPRVGQTLKLCQKVRAWADAFQTFEWEKAIPAPDVALKETERLLALIG